MVDQAEDGTTNHSVKLGLQDFWCCGTTGDDHEARGAQARAREIPQLGTSVRSGTFAAVRSGLSNLALVLSEP